MQAKGTNTSSNLNIGAAYKKVFCNLSGSYISHDECAYSTITHDPRLSSTPPVDPCVSCKVFIESTNISDNNREQSQTQFPNPPFDDLDFILVGLGEKGKNCGVIFASYLCRILKCLKVHYSKQSCERKACPECYKQWLAEERENILARLISKDAIEKNKEQIFKDTVKELKKIISKEAIEKNRELISKGGKSKKEIRKEAIEKNKEWIYREAKKKKNGMRLVDIMVSPDQKNLPAYRKDFNQLVREGYDYIKGKGAKGGCAIIHPFRATKEAKRLSLIVNVKTWKWIREQENPERYFYYSPHLHVLAYIDYLSEPEEGEGWVYKTLTEEDGHVVDFLRKAKKEKVLRKRINYFLSHTGTLRKEEGKFHSVRWFGACSYNKFGTTEEEIWVREEREENKREKKRCKICGGELMPFWEWVKMSYGDVLRDIMNNNLDPPRYWEEVLRTVEREDPPADAEKYLI